MKTPWTFAVLGIACSGTEGPCPEIDAVVVAGTSGGTEIYHLEPATLRVSGDGFQVLPDGHEDGTALLPRAVLEGPQSLHPDLQWISEGELVLELAVSDPPARPGSYDLVVTNPDGCSATLADAVRITDRPVGDLDPGIVISAVVPPFGWTEAPTAVTILGSGFESTPRAWLAVADGLTRDHELEQLAFIDTGSLSGVVPAGLPVGGPYDLVLENPGGGYNFLEDAFTVTADPPPDILEVEPPAGDTQSDTAVVITGAAFRDGASVTLIDSSGATTEAAVSSATTESIQATVPSSSMAVGQYLVRVTNPDGAWDTFAAFVVRNPSAKLGSAGSWAETTPMVQPRRAHGLVSWVDELGRAWLIAVGGDDGSAPLDTAERAQVDAFGELGPWARIGTRMTTPRTQAAWVVVDGAVYAIGGDDGAGTLDTVERAFLLVDDAGVRPVITDATAAPGGSLASGTWYYRVSAVMVQGDPINPAGESLASQVRVVRVEGADDGAVTLTWEPLAGAASYRVYRTDNVDGAAGQEHRIAEDIDDTTFTDEGLPAGSEPWVADGTLGTWSVLPDRLPAPRSNGAPVVATTPEGDPIVYLVGGSDGVAPTGEVFAMQPPGPWTVAGSLQLPRSDNAASLAGFAQAVSLGEDAPDSVLALHGDDGGGATAHIEHAEIGPGGALGPFTDLSRLEQDSKARVDGRGLVAADHVYVLGGGRDFDEAVTDGRQAAVQGPGLDMGSWSSTSASGTLVVPRAEFGLAPLRATLYVSGGRTDDEAATASVEQAVY